MCAGPADWLARFRRAGQHGAQVPPAPSRVRGQSVTARPGTGTGLARRCTAGPLAQAGPPVHGRPAAAAWSLAPGWGVHWPGAALCGLGAAALAPGAPRASCTVVTMTPMGNIAPGRRYKRRRPTGVQASLTTAALVTYVPPDLLLAPSTTPALANQKGNE